MSINWVMLDDTKGFVPLPNERILFTSAPRTTLALQTPNSHPGQEPLGINSSGGTAFITNQRLVYLPLARTPQLQSFSSPILNLQDTHVSAPFFGPNVWTGVLQPVSGGGIPPHHAFVQIKMIFKDGGAYDFHATFERMKETLSQAIEVARESGHMTGNQGQMHGVDLSAVHLEQLPAYEDITENAPASPPPLQRPIPISPPRNGQYGPPQQNVMVEPPDREETRSYLNGALQSRQSQPPSEPPPGYEEVQQNSVVHNLEASVHRAQ